MFFTVLLKNRGKLKNKKKIYKTNDKNIHRIKLFYEQPKISFFTAVVFDMTEKNNISATIETNNEINVEHHEIVNKWDRFRKACFHVAKLHHSPLLFNIKTSENTLKKLQLLESVSCFSLITAIVRRNYNFSNLNFFDEKKLEKKERKIKA